MKIPEERHAAIASAYVDDLVPMIELAEENGCSRQLIYLIITGMGVDPKECGKVRRKCAWCHKMLTVNRTDVRRSRESFCDNECHDEARLHPRLQALNLQTRSARGLVRKFFPLEDEHVVCIETLMVFKSHGAHRRWHRTGEGKPLWRGDGKE